MRQEFDPYFTNGEAGVQRIKQLAQEHRTKSRVAEPGCNSSQSRRKAQTLSAPSHSTSAKRSPSVANEQSVTG